MAYVTAAVAKAAVTALADYTDAQVNAKVAMFEEIAEEYRGIAYVTRTVTDEEIASRPLSGSVNLEHIKVQTLTSVDADGVALDLTSVTVLKATGVLHNVPWPSGTLVAEVTYTHGLTAVPARITEACIKFAAFSLAADNSGTSRDVRSQAFDGGTTAYVLPNVAQGRPTGWTDVDYLLNLMPDYRMPF